MLQEILGCLNVRVAGGKRENMLYGLLLIFSGVLFTYTAIGILPTYGEKRLSVVYYDITSDSDWLAEHVQYPGIEMHLNPNYDQAHLKPSGSRCSGWESYVEYWVAVDVIDGQHWMTDHECHAPQDIVCEEDSCSCEPGRGGFCTCEPGQFCKVWKPGPFVRFELEIETSHNFPASSAMKWNRDNEMIFCSPANPLYGGHSFCETVVFPVIAHDISVSLKLVGVRNGDTDGIDRWEYHPTVTAIPVYNPAYEMPNETLTTITVHAVQKVEVQVYLEKSAWQVWAELGGAWGGAMLILGVCFAQKSVRGKNSTSPNTEVQVFRLRKIGDRRALLQELAAMLQDAEEASEANGGPCRADVVGQAAECV